MATFMQSFGSTLAFILVLVVAIIVAVWFYTKRQKEKAEHAAELQRLEEQHRKEKLFEQFQIIVSEEIRDVCELALVRKNFSAEISFEDDQKLPLFNVTVPGTSRKMLLKYSGTIVCGFDFNDKQIVQDETHINGAKVFIPQSKILDLYPDMKSIKIFQKETGIFVSDFKPEEQNARIAASLEEQKQKEIQDGLLLRADENARKLLRSRVMTRLMNLDSNNDFDFEVLTLDSGNVPRLNPPK